MGQVSISSIMKTVSATGQKISEKKNGNLQNVDFAKGIG